MRTPILAALLALLTTPALAGERPADLDRELQRFESRTGVDVHLQGYPGPQGVERKENGRTAPVDPALVAKALPTIEEALMKYTPDVRGGLLRDLTLVGKLRARGKPFLGAAYPKSKSFDLAIRPRTSQESLRRTLHHEIAHLVESSVFFQKEMWQAFSGDGYVGASPNTKWAKGRAGRDEARRHGFVSIYGSKNHHEDFAELAELAFTRPANALALSQKYPLIGDKLRVMTSVYGRLAPTMKLPWLENPAATGQKKTRRS